VPHASVAPAADLRTRRLARVELLRHTIREQGGKALLVVNDRDIRYLTGFTGEASWAVVLAGSKKVYVLSDSRFEEEIPLLAPDVTPVIRETAVSLVDELKKVVRRHRIDKLLIPSTHITLGTRKELVKQLGARTLEPVDHLVLAQRMIKDEHEIAALRRAVDVQERAFRATCEHMQPGMSEGEVCGYLEMQIRMLGGEGSAFETIVGAGANSSKPHYNPGAAKLGKNDIVLIDWGAKVDGYRSDMTRVVALGQMPAAIREIYSIVLEAHLAAVAAIGPGVPLKEVDAAARGLVQRAGFGERFRHGLGHGIGLDIHENPRMHPDAEGELQPGHVVTVEPGIYLPGVGGVRLEDDVLVTETGCEVLCGLPKDVENAILR
jgi:Xaa-Pro aminopeptidase